jgi:rare lipoprotein A
MKRSVASFAAFVAAINIAAALVITVNDYYGSVGLASWYHEDLETASGEPFNMYDLTAAHRRLPFGTVVDVTNLRNGRSVRVRINDRGPFKWGRIIDLSFAAADELGMVHAGLMKVRLRIISD